MTEAKAKQGISSTSDKKQEPETVFDNLLNSLQAKLNDLGYSTSNIEISLNKLHDFNEVLPEGEEGLSKYINEDTKTGRLEAQLRTLQTYIDRIEAINNKLNTIA